MLRCIGALAQIVICIATSSQLVKESWSQSGDVVSSSVVVGETMISKTCHATGGPVPGQYGTLAAYNDTTREQIWAFGVDGEYSILGCTSEPMLVQGRLVFTYNWLNRTNRTSGEIYETLATYMIAVEPATGKTLWNITVDSRNNFDTGGELIVFSGMPIRAFEADTGDLAWSFNGTEAFALKNSTPVAVNESQVLVSLVSADGREAIGSVDVQSGGLTWATSTAKGTGWGSLYFGLADRIVMQQSENYVKSGNYTMSTNLTALDIKTGKVVWTASPFSSPQIQVSIAGAVAFVLSSDGMSLQAVDLVSGDTKWTLSLSFLQPVSTLHHDAFRHPLIVKGLLLYWDDSATQNRVLYGIDVASGDIKWNTTFAHLDSTLRGIDVDDTRIFMAVENGAKQPVGINTLALDAATGRNLWTRGMPDFRSQFMVIHEGEVLLVSGSRVRSLNATTGAQKWTNDVRAWSQYGYHSNNINRLFVRGAGYYAVASGTISHASWIDSGKWTVPAAKVDVLSLGVRSNDSFPRFCLDLPGNDARHGVPLWIWECNGASNQQWSFLDGSLVFSHNANLCVTLVVGKNSSAELQTCSGSKAQVWSLDDGHLRAKDGVCLAAQNTSMGAALSSDNCGTSVWWPVHLPEQALPKPLPEQVPWSEGFSLTVPISKPTTLAVSDSESKANICLDMLGGDPIEGYTVAGWNCIANSKAQSWILLPATNQIAFAADMRKCLAIRGSNVSVGAVTEIRMCDASTHAQQWELDFDSGHIRYIADTSFCLDVKETPPIDGASNTVQLQKCGKINYSWRTTINPQTEMVQCVDFAVPDHSITKSGARVRLWGCNQQSNQRWVPKDDGSVVSASSANLCLDLVGGEAIVGAPLQVWECNGQSSQQWHLHGTALSYGPNSTFCVEAYGAPGASRPHLVKCDEAEYGQRFSMSKPEPNPTEISMWDFPNVCLSLCDNADSHFPCQPQRGDNLPMGPTVTISSCDGSDPDGAHGQTKMHWQYQAGTSQLVSLNSSQCLSLPNASTSNGVQLLMTECNEGDVSQRWGYNNNTGIVSFGGDAVYCMDLPGNDLYSSNNYLQLWECNGLSQQRWRISDVEERMEHLFI